MKQRLGLLAIIALIGSGAAFAQGSQADFIPVVQGKVAYYSAVRVFTASVEGKQLVTRLAALQAERGVPIDAKNKALAAQREELRQAAPTLSLAVRNARAKELARVEMEAKRMFEDARAELMGIQRNAEAVVLGKLKLIVNDVVKERGLLAVFNEDAGAITRGNPSLDLTGEFIKRLDAQVAKRP